MDYTWPSVYVAYLFFFFLKIFLLIQHIDFFQFKLPVLL